MFKQGADFFIVQWDAEAMFKMYLAYKNQYHVKPDYKK